MKKNFKVKVNSSFEYELTNYDVEKLDLLKLSTSNFHLLHNNKSVNIHIEKSDFYTKTYVINVNSNSYKVSISNPLDLLINELGFTIGSRKKRNNINAPMPGLILSIHISIGQEVKEGDPLLVLEAMKMENTIIAHKQGIIKAIKIKNGVTVEKGELMIEME